MVYNWKKTGVGIISAVFALSLTSISAVAAVFPDVPANYPYRYDIELLVQVGAIGGHPDGTFKPEDPVTREQMVKMLYIALGKSTGGFTPGCFDDIEPGRWSEPFVCTAAKEGAVRGRSPGKFDPGATVNRVEALKMTLELAGIKDNDFTEADIAKIPYSDVSASAWYTKYVHLATAVGILPIAGQGGDMLYPDKTLTRGEAAAYIASAMRLVFALPPSSEGSSSSAVSSEKQVLIDNQDDTSNTEDDISYGTFPISKQGAFDAKKSAVIRFKTEQTETVEVLVSGGVKSCILFHLNESGYALEFYQGFMEGGMCKILVSLGAGDYQLDITPASAGASYSVDMQTKAGDGNDGFVNAYQLRSGSPRTTMLEQGETGDWYKFTVTSPVNHKVAFIGELSCEIFPMEDVDLFGFSNPQCNKAETFQPGTYYVGVMHEGKRESKTYTIRFE